MKVNEILALINAGYTKEEISAMELGEEATPKTIDENKGGKAEVKDEPKPTPKDEPKVFTQEQVLGLIQSLNAGNASIDVPKKVTIDETMAEHFKDLLLGK